jgi:expansin (peptidoglycan-binding protein)
MFSPSSLLFALFAILSLVSSLPLAALPNDDCSDPTPATSTPASSPLNASLVEDASSGSFTGGVATYFYQGGNPGACGQYNSDSAMICAMDQSRFGTGGPGSSLCNKQVKITNLNNGNTLTVTIVDDCPTCQNENSIDLSVAAFQSLTNNNLGEGEFPIAWSYA